jgi:hypothetical protein
MTKATVTLLGRATVAEEFTELWNATAEVGAGTVTVAPVVPAAAAGHELIVSVLPSGGSANFGMFVKTAPEPQAEEDATGPTGPSLVLVSPVFGAFAGKARRAPFTGSLVALCRAGKPQPSL